jgi:hypothetical protein
MQVYFDLRHQDTVQSSNGSNHIVPANYWTCSVDDPTPQLSHDCGSYKELSCVIDAMIADLENLRRKAKGHFVSIARAKA